MSRMHELVERGPREKVVFLVRDPRRQTQSYTWRIWSSGTSFYIKPRHPPVAGFKVSLHGPRSPGDDSLWKVAVDWRDRDAASAAGGRAIHHGDDFKHVFHGRRIAPAVRLAVRIRNPWTTFHRGSPSGPGPHEVRSGDHGRGFHCVVKPPRQMAFADVDIYVSDRAPYWPREEALILDNSKVGWLTNDAGQHLTAVSFQRGLQETTPAELTQLPRPTAAEDATRAVGAGIVGDVLWIDEQVTTKKAFDGSYELVWDQPAIPAEGEGAPPGAGP